MSQTTIGWIDSEERGRPGQPGPPGVAGQNATALSAQVDEVAVFASSATNPPAYKRADALVTLPQSLSVLGDVAADSFSLKSLLSAPVTVARKLYALAAGSDSLTYGSSAVLTTTGSVANAIGVLSDGYGRVTTSTSSTPAVLSRPLSLNTRLLVTQDSSVDGVFVRNTASTQGAALQILNSLNATALYLGGYYDGGNRSYNSKRRWGLAMDHGGSLDRLKIEHALDNGTAITTQIWENNLTTITTPLSVTSTVTASSLVSNRHDVTAAATNPGTAVTVWRNSGDSSRLYDGANKLAWVSEIPAAPTPTVTNFVASASGNGFTSTHTNNMRWVRDGPYLHLESIAAAELAVNGLTPFASTSTIPAGFPAVQSGVLNEVPHAVTIVTVQEFPSGNQVLYDVEMQRTTAVPGTLQLFLSRVNGSTPTSSTLYVPKWRLTFYAPI